MILHRSTFILHLHFPSIRSFFLSTSSSSPSLSLPRRRFLRPFGSSVVAAELTEAKGRDTFLAEDNVSWDSIGLSHSISKALSSIGLHRPSLVQVFFFFSFSIKFLLKFLIFWIPFTSNFDFYLFFFSTLVCLWLSYVWISYILQCCLTAWLGSKYLL